MIVFILLVHVCYQVDNCTWARVDEFISEVECNAEGRDFLEKHARNPHDFAADGYSCVARMRPEMPKDKE